MMMDDQEVALQDVQVRSQLDQDGGSIYRQTVISDEDHSPNNFSLTLKTVNLEDSNGGDCNMPFKINLNQF